MGASLGSGSGGRDRRRYRKQRFTEINVTPMVDVMLVLLIIFMVTAPMLTAGVQVDIPKSAAAPLPEPTEPLNVTVTAEGKIYINKTPVTLDELGAKLKAIAGEKSDTRIFVRGDKGVDYGHVMQVIGEMNASGFTKIALVSEQTEDSSSRHGR